MYTSYCRTRCSTTHTHKGIMCLFLSRCKKRKKKVKHYSFWLFIRRVPSLHTQNAITIMCTHIHNKDPRRTLLFFGWPIRDGSLWTFSVGCSPRARTRITYYYYCCGRYCCYYYCVAVHGPFNRYPTNKFGPYVVHNTRTSTLRRVYARSQTSSSTIVR